MTTVAGVKRPEQTRAIENGPFFEILTAEMLAERWRVPASWIREKCRSRCADPIPHIRLGRYVRFSWGSPELTQWFIRRQQGNGRSQ
jgi:hypothetical protein